MNKKTTLSTEEYAELKAQILAEAEEERKRAEEEQRRKEEELRLQVEEEIRKEEELKAKILAEVKNSKEPWVDIRGIVDDPEHGIKIELDWNDAFVKFLRDHGFTGASDEQVVQQYIAIMFKNIVAEIEDEELEKLKLSEKSDFE